MPASDTAIKEAQGPGATCQSPPLTVPVTPLHTPAGTGPWPAVIMFPDAGGVRATFHDMAQQLADLGYAVLLPNVYYRLARSSRST